MNIQKKVTQTKHVTGLLFVICSLLFSVSACSDFLEVEPQNLIVLDQFWNEKADVEAIINGCYSRLQSEDCVKRMIVWGEVRGDNVSTGIDTYKDYSLQNALKENIDASNGYTDWTCFYTVINNCNTVIKYAPGVAERDLSYTESDLKATIAEASALRDLCYFYLIRTFRDVPFTTEAYTDDDQTMDLPATKFDDLLDFLISDLESVKGDAVKRYPDAQKTYQTARITQDAINAMLCEMYLWKQDYQKCIDYADLVIASKTEQANNSKSSSTIKQVDTERTNGFPLIGDGSNSTIFGYSYAPLFYTGNSNEGIFELTYTGKASEDKNTKSNTAVSQFYGNAKAVTGFLAPSQVVLGTAATLFKKRDARQYEACNTSKESIAKFVVKDVALDAASASDAPKPAYATPWTDGLTKANWIVYRLTDIMLLKAEALAGLMVDDADDKDGSLKARNKPYYDQAFNLVNAVNKRSVCRKSYPADFLAEDTLDMETNRSREKLYELVLEERQRELMFEGKRWYDLVRMARREGSSANLAKLASKKQSGGGTMAANRLQKMDAIYWPYNINELKVNANLVQNPAFGSGENDSYK